MRSKFVVLMTVVLLMTSFLGCGRDFDSVDRVIQGTGYSEFDVPTVEYWHLYDADKLKVELPPVAANAGQYEVRLREDHGGPVGVPAEIVGRFYAKYDAQYLLIKRDPAWFEDKGRLAWFEVEVFFEGERTDFSFMAFFWYSPFDPNGLETYRRQIAMEDLAPKNLQVSFDGVTRFGFDPELQFELPAAFVSFSGKRYEVEVNDAFDGHVYSFVAHGTWSHEEERGKDVWGVKLHDAIDLREHPLPVRSKFRIRAVWQVGGSEEDITGEWSEPVIAPVAFGGRG